MFKTGLPPSYAEVLRTELENKFKIKFSVSEDINCSIKMEAEELTSIGDYDVELFIDAFTAGVKAVDAKLDGVQMHLTKAQNVINQL